MPNALVSSDLLAGLRAGDHQAQEALVRELTPRLQGMARRAGFTQEDAEEIVQDALSAALRQLQAQRFEGRSQVGSWIHAIFKRRVIDHRRAHGRRLAVASLDGLLEERSEKAVVAPALDTALTLRVRAALERLSPVDRALLLMNAHIGHSASELAVMLKRPTKTTEAMVTAARRAFREAYLELLDTEAKGFARQQRLT